MKHIRVILLSVSLIVLLSAIYAYLGYAPGETAINKHFPRTPGELVIFTGGREVYFKDHELIARFDRHARNKKGQRIAPDNIKSLRSEAILQFDYGYKEKGMYITQDGRIIFAVDKAEIRNRSLAGYVWWKINSLNDPNVNLYFMTQPDPEITSIARDILDRVKKRPAGVAAVPAAGIQNQRKGDTPAEA
ncbi:MAG: hypothetical protein ACOY46_01150 [Bacillota bacterium]